MEVVKQYNYNLFDKIKAISELTFRDSFIFYLLIGCAVVFFILYTVVFNYQHLLSTGKNFIISSIIALSILIYAFETLPKTNYHRIYPKYTEGIIVKTTNDTYFLVTEDNTYRKIVDGFLQKD